MKRVLVLVILFLLLIAGAWYVWSSGLLNGQNEDVHVTYERNADLLDDVVIAEVAAAGCTTPNNTQVCQFCRPDVVYLPNDGLLRARTTYRWHEVPAGEVPTLENIVGQTGGSTYSHSSDLTIASAEALIEEAKSKCSVSVPGNAVFGSFTRIHYDAGVLP